MKTVQNYLVMTPTMNNYIDARMAVSRNEFIKCKCHAVLYCESIMEHLDFMEEKMVNVHLALAGSVHPIKLIASNIIDTCSICLEQTCTVTPECSHHFHQECIDEIVGRQCPMCRTDI